MFGILKSAIGFGISIYSKIKGNTGSKMDLLSDALPFAVNTILPSVKNAISYGGMDTKEKFDSWLKTVDTYTGNDAAAIDLIPKMPADAEEEFFDHLIEVARIYGYMLLNVEGYHVS